MSRIHVAILGFAHGHSGAYHTAISGFDDATVIAGWDHNSARGEETCQRLNLPFVADLDALLARSDVHAVIITAETNRHADLVEAAAAAGKAILCQKPLATTLEDCDRIIAAVERHGVHFQMAFQMRCDPLNQQIKRWVQEGAVGRISALRRRHCINFLFNPELKNSAHAWHIDPVQNVGMFFDDAVHAADFLYWIQGRPVSVMAEIDNVLTQVAPDDTGMAIYRFADGSIGELFNSSITLAGENTCEIYGDAGTIIQNFDDGVSTQHAHGATALKLWRQEQARWESFPFELPGIHYERIKAVPRPWLDNLHSGAAPTVTARDGKVSVEMCLAAYQSAREGRRILL